MQLQASKCSPYGQQTLLILSYILAQYWVKGAMELEGEELEHTVKNRKWLQAAKGEVAAHTATCLQPVQLGCAFGSVGRGQAPLSASLVLHQPAACSTVVSTWRRKAGGRNL